MDKIPHFVAIHGLIKKGDKYLVTRRSINEHYMPEMWDIPGGHFDEGESDPNIVLKREIFEEVGLNIKINKIIHLFSEIQGEKRHQFQAIYECEYINGEVKLDLDEHSEYKWVTKEEMINLPLMNFVKSLAQNVL
jgi:8-oxo-dGTP pyrophosphatase MutT (NUDIX family)